ncbi:MAG: hypothetical protein A2W72_09275 [Burkholderiales bacterium RIFCSPLOWO2_12_67_14]|nr:MAG: hypothetical protein A2W72_09275 [Burkholderiales bacterium RIFCSPLOWO2_12_67_14]
MGGSSGGGGSGQSTTTSQASYAPEFRPLAESAVKQIQAMQELLPLISFTGYQPQPTAGLAPMQRFAIENLVPGTLLPTPGLQASQDTTLPLGLLGYGAIGAGGPTGAAQSALNTLTARLGQQAAPLPSVAPLQEAFGAMLPMPRPMETVFPGMGAAQLSGALPGATSTAVPLLVAPGGQPTLDITGGPVPALWQPPEVPPTPAAPPPTQPTATGEWIYDPATNTWMFNPVAVAAAAPQAGPPPGYMEVPGAPGSYVSIADFGSASA